MRQRARGLSLWPWHTRISTLSRTMIRTSLKPRGCLNFVSGTSSSRSLTTLELQDLAREFGGAHEGRSPQRAVYSNPEETALRMHSFVGGHCFLVSSSQESLQTMIELITRAGKWVFAAED